MSIDSVVAFLRQYDGKPVTLMEVCGTHTASIARHGIRSLLSPKISLVSGPGCPVCVTPAGYIDAICALALQPNYIIATFGDMLKVPGTRGSLTDAHARGAHIAMVYSPLDALGLARQNPGQTVVLAAVGFETTTPAYALLVLRAKEAGLTNLRLLTALKRMPPVLEKLCHAPNAIDGFLAPGHVSAILGSDAYLPLARSCAKPFVVAGFSAQEVLLAICDLVALIERNEAAVHNLYPAVVRPQGNARAKELIASVFEEGSAAWRGLGEIENSGLYLKSEYKAFDAGSREVEPVDMIKGCRCGDVLTGKLLPDQCPLFDKPCTPFSPVGPCMVSQEGACGIHYEYQRG